MKALLFDLDNTLIDRDGAVASWLRTVVPAEAVARLLVDDAGGTTPRPGFYRAVAEVVGCTPPLIRRRFMSELPRHIRPRPGLTDWLQRCAGRYRLGIASNGATHFQRRKLRAAGLDERWFATICVSQDLGVRKPDERFFTTAVDRLNVPAAQTVMIGDHPVNDIAGAHACGLRTCWLRTPRFAPPAADWTIDRLEEMPLP